MKNLVQTIKTPAKKERGATMVEYAIMVALIAVVAIGAVGLLGEKVNNKFEVVTNKMR